jgi:hypothetical protein
MSAPLRRVVRLRREKCLSTSTANAARSRLRSSGRRPRDRVHANPHVVVHLESAEDVVIVHGVLEDLGQPAERADVMATLSAKYPAPHDAQYLPTADLDFDVLWRPRPHKALLWQLSEYETTQARWNALSSP